MTNENGLRLLADFGRMDLNAANEANTRLKVIDKILREVLGWLDEDIYPEEHVTEDGVTTYSDYVLKTANAAIVVEAKKAGVAFDARPGQRKVKLTRTFLQSELGDAIVQARDYARKLGIDYAVATNGSVWAIYAAQRHDQVKFHDSTAIVFWSLQDALSESYQEFYDLLSRDAVISGSLEPALLGRVGNQSANRKLGNYFSTNAQEARRNPVFHIIEDELVAAFSDSIAELDSDSFERCYVAAPESIKFDHKIRMNVARRPSVVGGGVLKALKTADSGAIERKFRDKVGKKGVATQRSLALLVLGTVGAGKTTFLHYMRKVRLNDVFERPSASPHPHWLHLDFLNNAAGRSPADFIYRSILSYINDDPYLRNGEHCVKKAYSEEISALKSGPMFAISGSEDEISRRITDLIMADYQSVIPYVEKIIKFATASSPFFLIIDNVDQIEDEALQASLFTEALSISRALSMNLVLSLRQATFSNHRNSPAIDAFDFETVQIDSPRIASVLSKRFDLVRYLAKGHRGEFTAENGAHITVEDASQIVDLLQGSVLGTEIGQRIEVLATEDVRLALRMTREFLERGYTNPGRAIELYRRTGRYILPKHEAFRAIMLGTKTVYREDSSSIGNPFDSQLASNQMQLLRLFVLSAVVAYAAEPGFRLVDGSLISDCMRKIGVGDSYTKSVLVDLCRFRFIFTASHGEATLGSSYIPSRLGGYIVRELISNFTFVENVMYDTYVPSVEVWNKLKTYTQSVDASRDKLRRVRIRVLRAREFYNYMLEMYRPLRAEAQKRGLPAQWCQDVLGDRRADLSRELERVVRSAKANYGGASYASSNSQDDLNQLLDELAEDAEEMDLDISKANRGRIAE